MAAGIRAVGRDGIATRLILCATSASFCSSAIMVALSLLFALSADASGMGLDAGQSGLAYTWMAVSGLVFQLLLFTPALDAMGLGRMAWTGMVLMGVTCIALPIVPMVVGAAVAPNMSRVPLVAFIAQSPLLAIVSAGTNCISSALSSMLSDVTSPERQGLVMGLANSTCSLARAIGPLIVGSLFSLVSPWLAFGLMAAFYAVCLAILCSVAARSA